MLRRAFLGLLAAIPFIGKAKPKRGDFTLAELNEAAKKATYGPAHGAPLSTWIDWRMWEWRHLVEGKVRMMLVRKRDELHKFVVQTEFGGYHQSITFRKADVEYIKNAEQAVEYIRARGLTFEIGLRDVIESDTKFSMEEKIEILRRGEHQIYFIPGGGMLL